MELGRAVTKMSLGYSPLHLVIGSEGTLAIVTEITLKLIARPEASTSFILPFVDIDAGDRIRPASSFRRPGSAVDRVHGARHRGGRRGAHRQTTCFPPRDGPEATAYILVTLTEPTRTRSSSAPRSWPEIADEAGASDVLVIDQPPTRGRVAGARRAG